MEQVLHGAMTRERVKPGWAQHLLTWVRCVIKTAGRTDAPLRIEAQLRLGAKKSLVLVNCCGRQVLLAVNSDAITTVMEVPRPRPSRGRGGRQGVAQ